jgi:hypothetical protein
VYGLAQLVQPGEQIGFSVAQQPTYAEVRNQPPAGVIPECGLTEPEQPRSLACRQQDGAIGHPARF